MKENEKEWYSLKEIEKITGISVPSLSRYADEFKHYIRDRKSGNKRLVHRESISLLKEIKSFYNQNLNTSQIHERLKEKPLVIDVKDTDDIMNEIKMMKNVFQDEINQLKEIILSQQKYIDEKLNERDKRLMESLRMIQEHKKTLIETSSTFDNMDERKKEERKHKKWWKFW